jgi:hypothetical protein
MRFPGTPRLRPFAIGAGALVTASVLFVVSPLTRNPASAACLPTSSVPCPTPTPVNAFLSLDVTQGPPNTVINVIGGQFLPNEAVTLYWDAPNHVAGSATADGSGSFNTRIKPFDGDKPGVHKVCASVPPQPCANFALQAAQSSPSPSASPSEIASSTPSPDGTPNGFASVARTTTTISGFDVISKPPFVFLPIFGLGALLLSLLYWAFSVLRRPRQHALVPAAAVVHRATRPDYSAGFGAPSRRAAAQPEPSAWNEPMPGGAVSATPTPTPAAEPPAPAPLPETPPLAERAVEWGPPVEWGTGKSDWGFPEPSSGDEPDVPQPGD